MVGPSYKENEKLTSGEGERERERENQIWLDEKANSESSDTANWLLSDLVQRTGCRSASQGWMTTIIKNH